MKLEDTYNIHKKINCILPFFKSKKLCKKVKTDMHFSTPSMAT